MKKRISLNIFAIVITALLIFSGSALAMPAPIASATSSSTVFSPGDTVEVIWSQLRLREAPGTGTRTITILSRGQQGVVLSHQDNGIFRDGHHWWHVEFGGQRGWSAEGGLSVVVPDTPVTTSPGTVTVIERAIVAPPPKEWDLIFDEPDWSHTRSILQTPDGGFIILGRVESFDGENWDIDFRLVKINAHGNIEWDRTFGGSNIDRANSIQLTTDGGLIIAGETTSFAATGSDFWLLKLDAQGNKEWHRTFDRDLEDVARSVQQTADGGFIIAGSTGRRTNGWPNDAFWVIKTDEEGNKEWDSTFNRWRSDTAFSIQQTADKGFIIAGRSWRMYWGLGQSVHWLVRIDAQGNKEWDHVLDFAWREYIHLVQETQDGNFIVAGRSIVRWVGDSLWIIEIDTHGNRIWEHIYPFCRDRYGSLNLVQRTADGDFIIHFTEPHLVKLNAQGEREWKCTFEQACHVSWGHAVQETTDGGFIFAANSRGVGGRDDRDIWLVKTDAEGNKQWERTFGGPERELSFSVQQTTDGGFIIVGARTEPYWSLWLIKVAPEGVVEDTLPPSLAITSPADNERLATASVTVKGTATDAGRGDSGINRVVVNGFWAAGGTATGSGTANWHKTISLSPGANTITVVAFDDSPRQNSTTQTITVYYDTFDFSLSVNPTSGEVVRGGTVSTTVTATLTGGTTQPVSFSVTGLPSGVSVNNLPSGNPTISRTLTFTAASNAALGTHPITITATGGGQTRTATYSLTVKPAIGVTLTLFVRSGHAAGPVIPGARVQGQDGANGPFDKTTNASGYVKITGAPGTWHFTASKSGYQTNTWSQSITTTQTRHAFLQPLPAVSARIDRYTVTPREVTVGDKVTIGFTFTNTGNVTHTFGAGTTLRSPDGRRIPLILESVTVAPDRSGSVQWTSTIDRPGRWDVVFGVWGVPTNPPRKLLDQTGWVAEYITATEDPTPLPVPRFLTLPFRDVDIKIQQGWIYTWDPDPGAHKGIDYIKGEVDQLPWQSFDVVAAADGRAIRGSSPSWGTYVYIHHYERAICGNNYHTLYAHLESVNPKISDTEWTPVRRGEFIGRAGATGVKDRYGNPQPTWVHLHFELHIGDARPREKAHNRIDPYDLYTTREYYPGGQKYTRSGQNHLWTSDPPTQAPAAHLVITSPLEITPVKEFYRAGDLLTAQFTIANKGTELITFNVLVVGGRDPAGNIVDFDKAYNITLNPGDSYNYLGSLILPDRLGEYYFFIAYQTPDGKWHSDIDVKIDGEIIDTPDAIRFTVRDISVVWEGYIDPPPTTLSLWDEIGGPWEGWGRSLSQVAVHPNNPQVIYAVVRHYSWGRYKGDKLYRSINGGGTWTQINEGLPRPFLSEYLYPISAIAISPSNPNILYIGTSGFRPGGLVSRGKGVFKSTDGGLEWVAVGGPHPGGRMFDYLDISSIVVHPTNPDIVYVGTFREGIWKTTTGGGKGFLDWGRVWLSLGDVVRKVNALAISPANPDIIYAAAYNFDPLGPPIPKIPPIGLLVDNYFIRSEEGGRLDTWQELSLGYAFMPQIDDIFIDNKDPNIVYIVTSDFTVYKSSDGGENWNNISGIEGANPLPPSPFVQKRAKKSITVHPELSDVIFVGRQRVIGIEAGEWVLTTRGVYFTPNAGKDWLASDLQECIEELVFSSDGNSHILYAAGPHGLWRIDLSKGLAAMRLRSPGELRVYDSQGRVTGLVDGVVKQEIPHSVYDSENKIVTILSPIDTYRFVVAGVEKGEFGLTTALAHDRNVAPFTVADIPTSSHTTHQYTIDWDLLAQEDRGATVEIDADGDGVFEEKIELQLPRPSFIYSPVSPTVGQTITFDASHSYDPDGNITSYRWDFGDGVTEVGKTASHSFLQGRNYRVTLSVTDNDGVVNTSSKIVTARVPDPDPDPTVVAVDPANGCLIATAAFGTPLAQEVEVLSRFRDRHLLTNELGQRFVAFYYRHSPALAEYISDKEGVKTLVRIALWPLVRMAEFIVGEE